MAEKVEVKAETLLNLDDLLQCPVCYEIPTGQIFQCNEGHHVCGRCKMRLDVCPVCRAFFFGTRNYAMEELIANFKKLRSIKPSTKGSGSSNSSSLAKEAITAELDDDVGEDEDSQSNTSSQSRPAPPQACKGLFRCLCCKNGNAERLPAARLLNHLRYFHRPDLIEGQSENGEYLQAWQFPTVPGRLVTAVRVADMGVFFLIIEIDADNSLYAWLTMAASPWVAHAFNYSVTISGNDREAIFSDCVWSVRSCEGSLKKRGHCLAVKGLDAEALLAPATISGKLSVRRLPVDQLTNQTQPRAVLRVANRGNTQNATRFAVARNMEPFLQDFQNDVERLSRVFAAVGREANTIARTEAEIRSMLATQSNNDRTATSSENESQPVAENNAVNGAQPLSRNARRRMRQRLRAALNAPQTPGERPAPAPREQNPPQRQNGLVHNDPIQVMTGLAITQEPPVPPPNFSQASSSSGPSAGQAQPAANGRPNKKKRRHRR
ncbi:uncharacterized protein LOC119830253 isoform X1 [Zerene cesonia]|uniref:uncharacterized protein LOC119830253 isoform X1 n=1 Tax=Zerene cesonia TaxID=33412 RepID=UPI0018E5A985|nr:uncharacterized protein LOC119830253 isoform X1 [Zerene cesonia]